MKVGTKLFSVVALMTLVVILVAGIGFYAAKTSNDGLETVYKDRVEPLEQIKTISDMYAINIVDTTYKIRDGAIDWSHARQAVSRAQAIIADKWKLYLATYLDPEEKKRVAETISQMKKTDEAIARLNMILAKEDRAELALFAASELYQAIDPLTRNLSALIDVQLVVAKQEYVKSELYYQKGMQLSIVIMIIGLLLSGLLAIVIIRKLLRELGGEPSYVRAIAQSVTDGDFSIHVLVDSDKQGSVLWGMNIMVQRLRDLISEKDSKNQQLEQMGQQLDKRIAELEDTLDRVNQLEGIITICMYCKKIRVDQKCWQQLETYISNHSEAMFSHGICPECYEGEAENMRVELENLRRNELH